MSVDADIARRLAAQFDIAAEVGQVAYLVEIAAQPRQSDMRRWATFQAAAGDLAAQLACGQDFDRELSVLGACVLEWKESRLAEIAAAPIVHLASCECGGTGRIEMGDPCDSTAPTWSEPCPFGPGGVS